jgi:hypothetical protein
MGVLSIGGKGVEMRMQARRPYVGVKTVRAAPLIRLRA